MPPGAFQSVFVAGHASPLLVFIRHHEVGGVGSPPLILLTAQTRQRERTSRLSPDDKVLLKLTTDAHGSQHALPSVRHLPGFAQTQPGKPSHYSL